MQLMWARWVGRDSFLCHVCYVCQAWQGGRKGAEMGKKWC